MLYVRNSLKRRDRVIRVEHSCCSAGATKSPELCENAARARTTVNLLHRFVAVRSYAFWERRFIPVTIEIRDVCARPDGRHSDGLADVEFRRGKKGLARAA